MTEAVYAHPDHIETKEGPMSVVLRIDWSTHLIVGVRATLISCDDTLTMSPAFFWALLDEDAQTIYDEALKALFDPTI